MRALVTGVTALAALGALTGAPVAGAQVRPTPAIARPDTVRGVAYDSLAGRPLPGAFITAEPGGETAVADSAGRFLLVSARPVRRLVAFHDLADQLGFGELSAVRPDSAAPWARAMVAIPGIATVWNRLCAPARRPGGLMGGIVFGTVTAADRRTRVGGIGLVLQWESMRSLVDSVPRLEQLATRTDSLGNYVFCGVQDFGPAAVVASSSAWRSDNVLVPADPSSLRRVDLIVGPVTGPGATATVQGRVLDETGAYLPAATVSIGGVPTEILSGPNGRFTLPNVPTGSRMIAARRLATAPPTSGSTSRRTGCATSCWCWRSPPRWTASSRAPSAPGHAMRWSWTSGSWATRGASSTPRTSASSTSCGRRWTWRRGCARRWGAPRGTSCCADGATAWPRCG
jgi:hypothetical protein